MSALQAEKVREHDQHDLLHEGRDEAGDESTGSDFAGHGEEDNVAPGGGDYRNQRPADAVLPRGSSTPSGRANRDAPALNLSQGKPQSRCRLRSVRIPLWFPTRRHLRYLV
jgi:hypothetical protein